MQARKSNQNEWSKWHNTLHKKLLADENLLPNGSSLVIAVSGGQDSMAMLKILNDLKKIHQWELQVWHGDHGWHEKSKQIAIELSQWCKSNNLNFILSNQQNTINRTEADARNWRYKELESTIRLLSIKNKKVYNYILTGHTGSDRAETFLINLARGTDLAGLSSLRSNRNLNGSMNIVRPMIDFSREDTAIICKEFNLPIWLDPSNENKKFARNRIRLEVLPTLEDLYPGCSKRIADLAERLTYYNDDKKILSELTISLLSQEGKLNRKTISELPSTLRATILKYWTIKNGIYSLDSSELKELSTKIGPNKKPGCIHLKQGWKIIWTKIFIYLERTNQTQEN